MIKRALTGLALIASLSSCGKGPVFQQPEGGRAIKMPAVCVETTFLANTYERSWQLNCKDTEGNFHYFRWRHGSQGYWQETEVIK